MAKTLLKSSLHYNEDESGGDPSVVPAAVEFAAPMEATGMRLDQLLARELPQFSRNRLKAWIEEGAVTLDGRGAEPKQKIRGGETVRVQPSPAPDETAFGAEAIGLDIVHEDAAIIVINKPAGLVAHPAAGNWSGTLLNALLHHVPALSGVPRAGIVHRLDKETSGLLVVAKTLEAQTALVRQLQAHSVRRVYWALVAGELVRAGSVDAAIGRHPAQRTRMAVLPADAAGAKAAITHYTPLQHYQRDGVAATLVECRLETGRTHQIRVHLQHAGYPLVGDPVYGRVPTKGWFSRQALHARELALIHPASGKEVSWQAALPADMEQLIATLEPE